MTFSLNEGPMTGRLHVVITSYMYALDLGDEELLAYHCHPRSDEAPRHAHLHVGTGGGQPHVLTRKHLATGWTHLSTVIRLAIEEFEVVALRKDALSILPAWSR